MSTGKFTATGSGGKSSLPNQTDIEDLKKRIDNYDTLHKIWMGVGTFIVALVPFATGIIGYHIADIKSEINTSEEQIIDIYKRQNDLTQKFENDVSELYKSQRDVIETREEQILNMLKNTYEQKMDSDSELAPKKSSN